MNKHKVKHHRKSDTKTANRDHIRTTALESYYPGKTHWVLQHTGIARDVPCISAKLKLLTGSYILQVNRAAFNQKQLDPTYMMCKQAPETVDHFPVECSVLEEKGRAIMDSILLRHLAILYELWVYIILMYVCITQQRILAEKISNNSSSKSGSYRTFVNFASLFQHKYAITAPFYG